MAMVVINFLLRILNVVFIPTKAWFRERVDVVDDEITLQVEEQVVLTKKLTYYFSTGCPGFYVGTSMDAMFRQILIQDLN